MLPYRLLLAVPPKVSVGDFCIRIEFLWLKSKGLLLAFRVPFSYLLVVVLQPILALMTAAFSVFLESMTVSDEVAARLFVVG